MTKKSLKNTFSKSFELIVMTCVTSDMCMLSSCYCCSFICYLHYLTQGLWHTYIINIHWPIMNRPGTCTTTSMQDVHFWDNSQDNSQWLYKCEAHWFFLKFLKGAYLLSKRLSKIKWYSYRNCDNTNTNPGFHGK